MEGHMQGFIEELLQIFEAPMAEPEMPADDGHVPSQH
jgi:hypothetical protein